jgi:biotin carboxyl carrier protein
MTFEVEVNGRTRTIVVERVGRGAGGSETFRVTVDGRPAVVDARRVGATGWSLIFPDAGRKSYDVAVAAGAAGEWLVRVPAGFVRATVNGRRATGRAEVAGVVDGEQRIVAPMPGRVVRVLVRPGEEVAPHQGVVVIEAMKMENELTSPKAGRVKDVPVAEGMSVEAGRVLVVVE